MKEYEIFDDFLFIFKKIREFCDDREKMLFESIRMEISTDKVLSFIDRLSNERKSQFNLKK